MGSVILVAYRVLTLLWVHGCPYKVKPTGLPTKALRMRSICYLVGLVMAVSLTACGAGDDVDRAGGLFLDDAESGIAGVTPSEADDQDRDPVSLFPDREPARAGTPTKLTPTRSATDDPVDINIADRPPPGVQRPDPVDTTDTAGSTPVSFGVTPLAVTTECDQSDRLVAVISGATPGGRVTFEVLPVTAGTAGTDTTADTNGNARVFFRCQLVDSSNRFTVIATDESGDTASFEISGTGEIPPPIVDPPPAGPGGFAEILTDRITCDGTTTSPAWRVSGLTPGDTYVITQWSAFEIGSGAVPDSGTVSGDYSCDASTLEANRYVWWTVTNPYTGESATTKKIPLFALGDDTDPPPPPVEPFSVSLITGFITCGDEASAVWSARGMSPSASYQARAVDQNGVGVYSYPQGTTNADGTATGRFACTLAMELAGVTSVTFIVSDPGLGDSVTSAPLLLSPSGEVPPDEPDPPTYSPTISAARSTLVCDGQSRTLWTASGLPPSGEYSLEIVDPSGSPVHVTQSLVATGDGTGSGSWSCTADLAPGTVIASVAITGAADMTSEIQLVAPEEPPPPSVPFTLNLSDLTCDNNTRQVITGTVDPSLTVEVQTGFGTATATPTSAGVWGLSISCPPELAGGSRAVLATATDGSQQSGFYQLLAAPEPEDPDPGDGDGDG